MDHQTLSPMEIVKTRLHDSSYRIGLVFLGISLIIFCISVSMQEWDNLVPFFLNYGLAVFYFIMIWAGGWLKRGGNGIHHIFIWLLLCLVSAYSLNRVMNIFDESTTWFSIALVIFSLNYLAFAFFDAIPLPVKVVMFFILGVSICSFIYLTIYLMPIMAFSIMTFFVLGIPLHSFVPAFFIIYSIVLFQRTFRTHRLFRTVFWSSIGVVVVLIITFSLYWRVIIDQMDKDAWRAEKTQTGLHAWVAVSQRMPVNEVAQKILKSGFVYTVKPDWERSWFWNTPSGLWEEKLKHDPLVMTASVLGGVPRMAEEDRVHILESMYDSRHQAEERLWSGDDLFTSHIKTEAHIWPRLHMAYTEKTVTVTDRQRKPWPIEQEALYTFHLPEGAVVTSLSLWINNKEEKGILTTKAKADTAYKTIVGAERRDPSVVHWQEGNTVTVRVFPIMRGQSRQFKIGITSPLVAGNGSLEYSNIYFDGPATGSCREDLAVTFETPPAGLHTPGMFDRENNKLYNSGKYNAAWSLSFKDEGITSNVFSFNGRLFSIIPYKPEMAVADLQDVYLDVNNMWTRSEFDNVLTLLEGQRVWMYADNKMQRVTAQNKYALFAQQEDYRFSLFPFFKITTPASAMVITKGTPVSPATDELDDTEFMTSLKAWLGKSSRVMLFNLGGELSPYLRTLKECRTFRYAQGDTHMLQQLLGTKQFPAAVENDEQVVVEPAEIMIRSVPGTDASNAPDHLMRLFAYNHIMQQMGPELLTKGEEGNSLVNEAKEAYVVTPLSSLIVLETQADYDRFNIKDSENSLKNASLHSQGAVPEPHEWALIILVILVLIYAKYRMPVKKGTAA